MRAKHGPLPATADAFYQWPTRNAVAIPGPSGTKISQ